MSSDVYQKGKDEILKQNLDLVNSSNLVLILVSDSYTFDETQDFIDQGTADDVASHELDADGYTQGPGSADRQTPANRVLTRDDGNSRIEFDFDDVTWADLGGGVSANNDVVGGVVIAEERQNNNNNLDDTVSVLIGYDDLQDNRQTNGSDITYSPDAEGMLQFQ